MITKVLHVVLEVRSSVISWWVELKTLIAYEKLSVASKLSSTTCNFFSVFKQVLVLIK